MCAPPSFIPLETCYWRCETRSPFPRGYTPVSLRGCVLDNHSDSFLAWKEVKREEICVADLVDSEERLSECFVRDQRHPSIGWPRAAQLIRLHFAFVNS